VGLTVTGHGTVEGGSWPPVSWLVGLILVGVDFLFFLLATFFALAVVIGENALKTLLE
jgi:hypothetical protein